MEPRPPTTDTVAGRTAHQHTPEEERKIREATLDETIEDTFPASDPPSSIPNPDDDEALERDNTSNG